jgi:hypothetical protein
LDQRTEQGECYSNTVHTSEWLLHYAVKVAAECSSMDAPLHVRLCIFWNISKGAQNTEKKFLKIQVTSSGKIKFSVCLLEARNGGMKHVDPQKLNFSTRFKYVRDNIHSPTYFPHYSLNRKLGEQ